MSAATVNISKKTPDGSLIAIGGTDTADFLSNAAILLGDDGLAALQDEIKRAFAAGAGGNPAPPQNSAPVSTQAPAAAPHGQQGPSCTHGQRTWKEGTSASSGRAWKAWMCPAPKGESCEPQWVR